MIAPPVISLPKGGGAISGIGEKFAANPVTGTASLSIPIATSSGRSGFGPSLALSYDSGSGNGPLGFGCTLSLAAITRKTDKGLPQYRDAEDSDVFMLSGSEDLVAVYRQDHDGSWIAAHPGYTRDDGAWVRDSAGRLVIHEDDVDGFRVRRYRPRIEGLFARIERWTKSDDARNVHWRSISRDNLLTIYGFDSNCRIFDPLDPIRIFSWLICETRDDRGNGILYRYRAEDGVGVDLGRVSERNRGPRNDARRTANRYLKRVHYGNRTSLLDPDGARPRWLDGPTIDAQINNGEWMFEVVFDYGDHDALDPKPNDDRATDNAGALKYPWNFRIDPFSSYRSGFEVRTTRRCERVLMFHHFPSEPGVGRDCLVRSTDFAYSDERDPNDASSPVYTFLRGVAQTGYRRAVTGYTKRSLPPLEFEYSEPIVQETVETVDAVSLENLPAGLDPTSYRWIDLHGEGIPGILTEQTDSWWYKRNLSPIRSDNKVSFAPLEGVASKPNVSLGEGAQFMDLGGDGHPDVVMFDGQGAGLYEHDSAEGWGRFHPFPSRVDVDRTEPNFRLIDLTGDGRADLLIAEDDVFTWYPALGEEGFGPARHAVKALDEERGPRLVFADGTESIYLADLNGDGLADLVRIRNGEICYWPNLGYGRFGAKITMDNAPRFDHPDQFDQKRVRLADIDGSGTTDILYLHPAGVRLYFNQSGNGWSKERSLAVSPRVNNLRSIAPADLRGNGTVCLVWSSALPGDAAAPMRYVDLTGGTKPHLLVRIVNNLGGETRVHYAPSTKFYLQDKRDGKPWITRLPFPIHVVESIETLDHISRHRHAVRVAYHHGFFDGDEREFRGFGMVEQWDTEAFEDYVIGVQRFDGLQELAPELNQPPVTTRTWYHTGAYFERRGVLQQFRHEYYRQEQHTPEPVLPDGLTPEEFLECVRALKGLPLRQEVYSFDGSLQQDHPYTVTENNFEVRLLQPRGGQRYAVFFPVGRESIAFNYERDPDDPRISHSFGLELDEYGLNHKSCSVVYGRKVADPSLPVEVTRDQQRQSIAHAEADYTPDIDLSLQANVYRLRTPCESRSFEITGIKPAAVFFTFDEIKSKIAAAAPIDYEIVANAVTPQRRRLAQSRTLFLDDDLNPLPFRQWDTLGLIHESYRLAFTPGIVASQYGASVTAGEFTAAGYVHFAGDANWWIPSGTAIFPTDPRGHFYVAVGVRDATGLESVATFDSHVLLIEKIEIKQATWNVVTAINDYRVLAPILTTDPNGSRSTVERDELGMVTKTAIMGKTGSSDGDTLADPTTRMEYELFNWMNNGKPNFVHAFTREQHGAANPRWQESYAYSSGSGSVTLIKSQAHPGKALQVQPDGSAIEVDADPRWLGNGRTIYNNKLKPVKQYQPYFSTTHEYEDEKALREIGATPIYFYDAAGRNVRTVFPNKTFGRVEFTSWFQKVFDANDTVKASEWYSDRGSPDPAADPEPLHDPERRAAWLSAKHADTPSTIHYDSLGRAVYAVSDYGGGTTAAVRVETDFTGRFSRLFDQQQREVTSGFAGMTGAPISGGSAERGRRWTFQDVVGALVKTWDEHGREYRAGYDALHRPVAHFVREGGGGEILINYVVYGDRLADALQKNLFGVPHQIFDQGGMIRIPELDFKGNPKSVERVLSKDYSTDPNWSALPLQPTYAAIQTAANPALEIGEVFTISAQYDALNRPMRITHPDGTVIVPQYNEASIVSSVRAQIGGQGGLIEFLKDQDYDAKGQRQYAHYGNDAISRYVYDPVTSYLTHFQTYPSGANPDTQALQNLRYTYDPIGHITQVRDDAQQTRYFNNAVVSAENLYEYDAVYQLVRATGRELAGLQNDDIRTHTDLDGVSLPHANDLHAVRTYTEQYEYDLLGNIKTLRHLYPPVGGGGSGWTRHYQYRFESTPGDRTNRLAASSMPGDPDGGPYSGTYTYDPYGNMTRMPHLPSMEWSFMDQLRHVDLGGGGSAHYVYGIGGQRLRKVVERSGDLLLEWIFLGAVVIFRRRRRSTGSLRLERVTVHIADNTGHIAQVDTKTVDEDGIDPSNPIDVPLIRYQFANHIGSAVLETDAAGNPVSYEEYHPYGTTAYRSAKAGYDLSLKRYRFTGKERDDETGLYFSQARYYAPWLGRWTSSDPAGFASGTNLFRYCANNPVMLVDPNGTQEMDRRFGLPASIANVPEGASAADIERRAGQLQRHVYGLGYRWSRDGAENPNPVYSDHHWNFGIFDPAHIPSSDPLRILAAPPPPPQPDQSTDRAGGGGNAGAAGGVAVRNNPPGNNLVVPEDIDDAKLARLREGVRQRTVGRNTGPANPTGARRNSPASRQALADFEARSPRPNPTDAAGHTIDMQYDLTNRVGTSRHDYVWEDGATNTNDGFEGFRRLRSQPQGVPAGGAVRPSEAGSVWHSPRFRTAMRWGGGGMAALGTGLSGYGLYRDVVEGDVPMGIGDSFGVVGGGFELYAFGAATFGSAGTTVGGVTVGGVAALPLGIALSGVAVAVTSGVSGYRAYERGDTAGAVAGGVGVVGGTMLAAGGGIALASAAGIAMAPALVAAAPVLIAAGAVLAIGVGIFHVGRYFDWW